MSLIANKQEFVKKKTFCCFNFGNSEIGQKLDGKAEIEEKIDGNSVMLPPCATPCIYIHIYAMLYKKSVDTGLVKLSLQPF